MMQITFSYLAFIILMLGWCIFVFWFGFFLFNRTRKSIKDGFLRTTQYSIDRTKNPTKFMLVFWLSWLVYITIAATALLMLPQTLTALLNAIASQN